MHWTLWLFFCKKTDLIYANYERNGMESGLLL